MEIFIKGVGNISPQNTINNTCNHVEFIRHQEEYLKCVEPEYKNFINPVSLRRMSRIIKMGVTAAQICLKEANIANPDAIITATGLGCVEDTENFLNSIVSNEEKLLNPTHFILSTHNTLAAQIALLLKCNKYNITHTHRGNSFESALIDAMLLMKENEANNILLGAADEITPSLYKITKRLNLWKKEPFDHLKLAAYKTKGTIAGEGAAFFALTNNYNTDDYAKICAVDSFYKPENNNTISNRISSFLLNNQLKTDDIDLVILGNNGDFHTDDIYHHLMENLFEKNTSAYYKHLSGEYQTSSSFAMWLAAIILKTQEIPQIVKLNDIMLPEKINNILIYNHYFKINHSLILLSKC